MFRFMLRSIVPALMFLLIIASSITLLTPKPSHSETIIGRWCDRMVPGMRRFYRIMTIVKTDSGQIVLKSRFGDGSSSTNRLQRVGSGSYAKADSGFGDRYRTSANGDLNLYDNEGFIRTATRLDDTPKSGECF